MQEGEHAETQLSFSHATGKCVFQHACICMYMHARKCVYVKKIKVSSALLLSGFEFCIAVHSTSSTSGLWRDLKTLVASEIAKMDEKFSLVFNKLSAVEARIERLEVGLQTPQTSKPAGTSTEFPVKRKRRTQLSLQVCTDNVNV